MVLPVLDWNNVPQGPGAVVVYNPWFETIEVYQLGKRLAWCEPDLENFDEWWDYIQRAYLGKVL
jgi:hypothetical protein